MDSVPEDAFCPTARSLGQGRRPAFGVDAPSERHDPAVGNDASARVERGHGIRFGS